MPYNPYLGNELPNLVNVTKRMDPDGSIAKIAELLAQSNPILMDLPVIEGNLPTGHRTTIRTGLPSATWRKLNYGVRPEKSTTAQVDDTIGMLEAYGEIDKDLAMLNGNTAEFRMSEDSAQLEAISQDMATTLFYGDTATYPERFLGLAPRYDTLTLDKPDATLGSAFLKNVIDMGGTGANLTSLWYVVWGDSTAHGIYPKGSTAGLISRDLGEQTLVDSEGGRFQGFRSHYQWKLGMTVRDWRYIVRVVNVDVSKIDDPTTQDDIYKAMIKAMHAVPAPGRNRGNFYCGAAISAMLDFASVQKSNAALGLKEVFGEPVLAFRGRPIRECNAILETEAQVV